MAVGPKKLTFYFTAEKRVDFRTLVRELASMFRTRIELKQIGVRDEAKRLDGVGRCGRQYLFRVMAALSCGPVNLGVAKDQRLSLNPSQISGACGRLMCCLRYEHEFYVQSRKKYPKEGKIVRTARGEEKVLANDIFRERVMLRGVDGEVRTLALSALRDEMLTAGDALAHGTHARAAAAELAAATTPLPVPSGRGRTRSQPEEALDTEHSPDTWPGSARRSIPRSTSRWSGHARARQQEGRRPQRRRGRRGGRPQPARRRERLARAQDDGYALGGDQ
jgi:hypothetical protein